MNRTPQRILAAYTTVLLLTALGPSVAAQDSAVGGGNMPVKDRGAVSIIFDPSVPAIRFAASDVKTALQKVGYAVSEVSLTN